MAEEKKFELSEEEIKEEADRVANEKEYYDALRKAHKDFIKSLYPKKMNPLTLEYIQEFLDEDDRDKWEPGIHRTLTEFETYDPDVKTEMSLGEYMKEMKKMKNYFMSNMQRSLINYYTLVDMNKKKTVGPLQRKEIYKRMKENLEEYKKFLTATIMMQKVAIPPGRFTEDGRRIRDPYVKTYLMPVNSRRNVEFKTRREMEADVNKDLKGFVKYIDIIEGVIGALLVHKASVIVVVISILIILLIFYMIRSLIKKKEKKRRDND